MRPSAFRRILPAMSKILVPTTGPESWRALLADPQKHWRSGYSAKSMAECWEAYPALPPEFTRFFGDDAELLLAIPEHKVALPGKGRESQNDLFALIRSRGETVAMTVEGKVNEPFGPTLDEWLVDASDGKRERLAGICDLLGITQPADSIRYQLLHRTASAVIEAERFGTARAAMIVHSFSQEKKWFEDFEAFAALFGGIPNRDGTVKFVLPDGRPMLLGWAQGQAIFLE